MEQQPWLEIWFAIAGTAGLIGGFAWVVGHHVVSNIRGDLNRAKRDLKEARDEREEARDECDAGRKQAGEVRALIDPEVASEPGDKLADLVERLLTKLRGTEESRKSVAEAHDRALKELAATRAHVVSGLKVEGADDKSDGDFTLDALANRLFHAVADRKRRFDNTKEERDDARRQRDLAKRDLREANADAEVRLGNLATTLEEGRQALGAAGDEFLLEAAQRVIGERDAARGDANEMREALAQNVKGTEATVREIGAERDEAREAARNAEASASNRAAMIAEARRAFGAQPDETLQGCGERMKAALELAIAERQTARQERDGLVETLVRVKHEREQALAGRKEIGVHVDQGKAGRWRWRRVIDSKTVASGPGSYSTHAKAVAAAKNAHPGLLVVVA